MHLSVRLQHHQLERPFKVEEVGSNTCPIELNVIPVVEAASYFIVEW